MDLRGLRIALSVTLAGAGLACVGYAASHQNHAAEVSLGQPVRPVAGAVQRPVATRMPAAPGLVLRPSVPTRLEIPAIRVRTPLLRLGQRADGTLAVPVPGPHYDQAGWYRYSPTPGARGPAVIVGHIDSRRGGPSVFFRLGELHTGDVVRVARADGTVATFAVQQVRRFHKSAFPTQLVYGNTDQAALRLITCGGPFDTTSGHYLDNIVVTATLLPPPPA